MSARTAADRVVITGMGVISPQGRSLDALWHALTPPSDQPVAPLVAPFDPRGWMTRKEARRSAPFTQLAVAAAADAWDSADLGAAFESPARGGVVISVAYGALELLDEARDVLVKNGPAEVSPLLGAVACENAPAAAVALRYGLRGPAKVVVGACAGGAMALADAADLIRLDRCDLVVAGGTQAAMSSSLQASYANLRVLSPSGWARPFDRRRDGFVFAEGAAAVVLERLSSARRRGAPILAELLGHATTNDAHDMARPTGTGAIECMQLAMADAGVDPHEVVAVDAHGTGTRLNDLVEADAIVTTFGRHRPPVTSHKGMIGHLAAAGGTIEAVAVVTSLQHRLLPPTAISPEPDPELAGVDVVWTEPRPIPPGPIVSNSFGLGGVNCSLVVGPPPPPGDDTPGNADDG